MAHAPLTEAPAPAGYGETLLDHGGRASWGAFFAGTAVALAVTALLMLLGLAIGMATINPAIEQDPLGAVPTASLWWTAISAIIALGAGGYVAGRFAGALHGTGSALHGATVWALTMIIALWLGASAVTGLVNLTGTALSQSWSAASAAAEAAIPEDFDLPDVTDLDVEMNNLPDPVRRALEQAGITPEVFGREMREIFRNVISQQEQERAAELAQETASEILASPTAAGQAIDDLVDDLFGPGGVISEEDRQEALQVMQDRFGITAEEAESVIEQVEATVEEYRQAAGQALQIAQQKAAEAAGAAADATSTVAWGAFITLLLGLLAAIGGALVGRPGRPLERE